MPVNRNALIRYKAIDSCLRNRMRKWTLEKLIEKVSDALYEYEGMSKGISRRTIQADIQLMRSNKLGYNAPIIIVDKKYYTYEDPEYSITNIPINEHDLGKINEAVTVLKQFKGFSHFNMLTEIVSKLESHVYSATYKTDSVIDFERNELLKGLEYLDTIYQAIIQKKVMHITYQSFKARGARKIIFHAWWLKEFKNRWFVIGKKHKEDGLYNLALDRIQHIELSSNSDVRYIENKGYVISEYYQNVIGVTVSPTDKTRSVCLFVKHQHAPYVETKPFHHSQEILSRDNNGITIKLKVQLNYELEREILGFGDGIIVLSPDKLRKRIYDNLKNSVANYKQVTQPVEPVE